MNNKKMNTVQVASLGIGSMVGAGIFALLGQVVLYAGNATYWAFLFAGAVALLCGYSYAKLSQIFPDSGGITEYYHRAFSWRFFATLMSLIYLATLAVSVSMLASSFAIYMTTLTHLPHAMRPIFGTAIILIMGLLNLRKSGTVGRIESILVFIKVAILSTLVGFGIYHFFDNTLLVHNNLPATNFWAAAAFAFFAYSGFGVMTNAAQNVNNPSRTITRAIYIALIFVILLYCALGFVVLNFVSGDALQTDINTAVSSASNMFLGRYGFVIMTIAGLIAIASGINALIYSSLKIIESMANNNSLPRVANTRVISRATIGFLALMILTSLGCIFLRFELISKIASAAFLVSYMGLFAAHFLLRKQVSTSRILVALGFAGTLFILIEMLVN